LKSLARGGIPPYLQVIGPVEREAARVHFQEEGNEDGFDFRAYSRRPVKAALSELSCGKCAYCEARYDDTEPVDVEHFRPKGAIETPLGRKRPGYWWLAAEWSNLLPSCIRCNRCETVLLHDGTEVLIGKGNHFPLFDESLRAAEMGEEVRELPMLLNPCVDNPADYLQHLVDDDGRSILIPRESDENSTTYVRGRKSIDLYGLNRAALVSDRSDFVRWARETLARITRNVQRLNALQEHEVIRRQELLEIVGEDRAYLSELTSDRARYAGTIREIVYPALNALGLLT
jgi:uncharacterized protein (TIGR02646 family)